MLQPMNVVGLAIDVPATVPRTITHFHLQNIRNLIDKNTQKSRKTQISESISARLSVVEIYNSSDSYLSYVLSLKTRK